MRVFTLVRYNNIEERRAATRSRAAITPARRRRSRCRSHITSYEIRFAYGRDPGLSETEAPRARAIARTESTSLASRLFSTSRSGCFLHFLFVLFCLFVKILPNARRSRPVGRRRCATNECKGLSGSERLVVRASAGRDSLARRFSRETAATCTGDTHRARPRGLVSRL